MVLIKVSLMRVKQLCALFFSLFCTFAFCMESKASVFAANGNSSIIQLNEGLDVLKKMSDKNTKDLSELKNSIIEQNSKNEKNSIFYNKKSWEKVKSLTKDYLLLLEASYAFARHSQTQSQMSDDEQRALAWSSCLSDGQCNFKKINTLLEKNDLNLSTFIKENAKNTQATLIDSIEKLNELSLEAQGSEGLNSSIDALTKVSTTQANVLVSLNTQISNLAKLKAQITENELKKAHLTALADQKAMKADTNIRSDHMSVMLGDIK